MKTVIYNNQTMIAYLLGSLPEAEAEAFDELSFVDDEFANELKAVEIDLIDAYVNGELSDENLEKFKNYYLASPMRREKVEFAQGFKVFAEKEMAQVTPIVEEKPKSFLANLLTIPRLSLQWGVAFAALALMFFGGWMLWENLRLRSEISQTQSNRDELLKRESDLKEREIQLQNNIANQQNVNSETEKELAKIREERASLEQKLKKQSTEQQRIDGQKKHDPERAQKPKDSPLPNNSRQPKEKELAQERKVREPQGQGIGNGEAAKIFSFVLLPPLRSGNKLPTLSIPPDTYSVEAKLQLESDDFPFYRVTLQSQSDSQTIWQSGKLRAAANGKNKVLKVVFLANLLKSQIYSLEISGINAKGETEIISNYPFRAVLK